MQSFALPKEMITVPKKELLGFHYIIDVQYCQNIEKTSIDAVLNDIIHATGLTELKRQSHEFTPVGYTAIVLLSESHLSVHTWPKFNSACFDLFTCNKSGLDTVAVENIILSHLGGKVKLQTVIRECKTN